MLVGIGILIALASWVANSVGGIVFGIVLAVIGLATTKEKDPVKIKEAEDKQKIEKMKNVMKEYDNDRFATILRKNLTEDEFRYMDDSDIISISNVKNSTGIKVLLDKIETPKKTYYYEDYNVSLNDKKLEDLAIYLQSVADQYVTTEKEIIHKVRVVRTIVTEGETHYFETPGGHLSSYDTGGVDELFQGYRVYISGKKVRDTSLKEW